ncbi:hypothetical protein AUR64_13160 [Haloprofundus marisrubri]|uniref:Uncharacterized protein n=1 Tax=Haloprofundus marisrubri TaxID=1514971 RepID=A0A0W1R5Q9_9EURY|nr:hypothetical protein [Haloprofundus marisrubri]KTG08771.1 hypothetical protein AUR64_13160 [Haloprofundus marisrubri]
MPDRVSHDNPSVTTHRARLERSGGTRRPCLRLPDDVDVDAGDIVRLVLDDDERHAKVDSDAQGLLIRGAYDNRRLARTPGEGENRLVEWAEKNRRDPGTSAELDEVEPGHLYGLRVPGKRAVYSVTRQPKSSLADIARQLDE